MSTTPTPNAQTPGPLTIGPTPFYLDGGQSEGERRSLTLRSPANTEELATVWPCLQPAPANAHLLAASYTMADRAGRELGVDAATLCERLDLAALIRLAQYVAHNARVCRDLAANVSTSPDVPTVEALRSCLAIMGEHAAKALPFMGRGPHGDLILGAPQPARTTH